MPGLGDALSVNWFAPAALLGALLVSWGFIVFMIVRGVLVPKPFHDIVVKTMETERETRAALQGQVEQLTEAVGAIATGVETIKAAVTMDREVSG